MLSLYCSNHNKTSSAPFRKKEATKSQTAKICLLTAPSNPDLPQSTAISWYNTHLGTVRAHTAQMRKFCEKSRTRCQYASTPTPRFYRGCFCYDTTLEKTIPCVIMAIVYRSRRTVLCGRLIPCFARRGWTPLLALHKHLLFLISYYIVRSHFTIFDAF